MNSTWTERTLGSVAELSRPPLTEQILGSVAELSRPPLTEQTLGSVAELSRPPLTEQTLGSVAELSRLPLTEQTLGSVAELGHLPLSAVSLLPLNISVAFTRIHPGTSAVDSVAPPMPLDPIHGGPVNSWGPGTPHPTELQWERHSGCGFDQALGRKS
ncbi:hypothetical protein P7K49_024745 [Saguinus oedipus]|uniref:Uncharacterized protein n=1 Tax=Saguinus oedipus TaxID=9490 RepID=A0ABQ9UR72_SAGOE|nr:hypothetical protein P7K49_024745 [Saguinus oedipus]